MRGMADIERFDGGDGAAIRAMMGRDLRAPYANVEGSAERIEFAMHRKIQGFLEKHSRNLLGRIRNKADLDDVIRARHGQKIDNSDAQAFSDAIGEAFEAQRQRFNAAGGDIGHRADFGVPHAHDARRVRAAGYEAWRAAIVREFDTGKMIDPLTGAAFTENGLEAALEASFETIRSDGLAGLGAAMPGGAKKLANRRSDPRFFVFKDGDAWLRYNEKFGSNDAFTAINDHIRGMSHDIAMIERFGPNPDATVKWLTDQMARRSAQSADTSVHALNIPATERFLIDKMWKEVSGQNNIPVLGGPIRSFAVKTVQGSRDLLTAALLGSSPLSAVTDANTIRMARLFNGLSSGSVTNVVTEPLRIVLGYLRQMNPLDAADRKLAIRLELGMRDKTQSMLGLNRYLGASQGPETTKVIADTALRISGINKLTEAGQRSFGIDFLEELAEAGHAPFDKLRPGLRQALSNYGLDTAAWDVMRTSPMHKERGREFMAADLIKDGAIAERMMDMVLSETVAAVQTTTAHARAALSLGPSGSVGGEVGKNLFQFKTFTASIMHTQGQRILSRGVFFGAKYAVNFFIGMTVMGAVALQLRQLSKGQEMRPMDNAEFWVDASLQGGGVGIFGDLIGSFWNDRGQGLLGLAAGPLVGSVSDVGSRTANNLKAAFDNKRTTETHIARDAVHVAQRYLPGSNTWYAKLAYQRLILDQLSTIIDPDFPQASRRMEKRAHDQRTEYYWNPGETAPERLPDFTNALGDDQ